VSFFGSLKKISIKKIVKTVTKTVKDATNIATGVATGGLAGGLAAVGSLSKQPSLTPTTVYGSEEAATAAGTANAAVYGAPQGTNSNMPLLIGAGVLVLLLLLGRR
jgi:hypothetical protein